MAVQRSVAALSNPTVAAEAIALALERAATLLMIDKRGGRQRAITSSKRFSNLPHVHDAAVTLPLLEALLRERDFNVISVRDAGGRKAMIYAKCAAGDA
jgi:hypothetical protein